MMEYIGADHYFFWQGIETAQMDPEIDPISEVYGRLSFKSETTVRCTDAFIWGFAWGLELTPLEIKKLTNPPKKVRIKKNPVKTTKPVEKQEEKESILDLEKDWPVKGNC